MPITRTVLPKSEFGTYRILQERCLSMPNVDGPRPSRSISGPTHFARQMTFIKRRQERRKLHHWRSSRPFPSGPRSTTSDHLDVRSMSYKDRYKLDRKVLSGTKGQEWDCISDHLRSMPDPLHWYSTSPQDWHLPSSIVSLTIYLRRLLTYPIQLNGRNRHTSSRHLRKLPRKFLRHR